MLLLFFELLGHLSEGRAGSRPGPMAGCGSTFRSAFRPLLTPGEVDKDRDMVRLGNPHVPDGVLFLEGVIEGVLDLLPRLA